MRYPGVLLTILWLLMMATIIAFYRFTNVNLRTLMGTIKLGYIDRIERFIRDGISRRRRAREASVRLHRFSVGMMAAILVNELRFSAMAQIRSVAGETIELAASRFIPPGTEIEITAPGDRRVSGWVIRCRYDVTSWVVEAGVNIEDRDDYLRRSGRRAA